MQGAELGLTTEEIVVEVCKVRNALVYEINLIKQHQELE